MKTYKLTKDITVYQDELNVSQDSEITNLFSEIDIDNIENIQIKDILKSLLKKDFLVKFFNIILINNDHTPIDESIIPKIKNTLAVQILKDFFSLNAELLNFLKDSLSSMASATNSISHTSDTEDS